MSASSVWEGYRDEALDFIKNTFSSKMGEYGRGLWSVIVKIVENVAKIDLDHDGIKEHYRDEIIRIAKDEAIQFGNDLTEGLIRSAEGGFLKKLLASAWIASVITKLIPAAIPYSEWVVGFLIERVVGMLKAGLVQADEKLDEWADKRTALYSTALGKLIQDLSTRSGKHVQVEYFWGSDTFILFVLPSMDAADELIVKIPGSVTALFEHQKNNYEGFLAVYLSKIEKAFPTA